jgi:hypothetical protein
MSKKPKFANGGALNNDPRFIPYNGQEIMFVPVYGTFWVDDIEFDTEDLAKKYIDKEYGKFADGGGVEKISQADFLNQNFKEAK